MGRRMLGLVAAMLVVGLAVVVAVVGSGASAGAGGADALDPDREFYRPGDPVHLAGDVYKADRDWFGPYTAYIRPAEAELTAGEYVQPGQHPADIAVGRLVVTRINPSQVRVEVTFVLPKVADGRYMLDYCGPDCSKRIGSLYASGFFVGTAPFAPPTSVPAATVPTTLAAPVTTVATTVRPATTTSTTAVAPADLTVDAAAAVGGGAVGGGRGSDEVTTWPWLAGSLLVVVAGAAVLVLRWRGPRHVVVTSATAERG